MFEDKIQSKLQKLVDLMPVNIGGTRGIVRKSSKNQYEIEYSGGEASLCDAYRLAQRLSGAGLVTSHGAVLYSGKNGMNNVVREMYGFDMSPRSAHVKPELVKAKNIKLYSNIYLHSDENSNNCKLVFLTKYLGKPLGVLPNLDNAIKYAEKDGNRTLPKSLSFAEGKIKQYLSRVIQEKLGPVSTSIGYNEAENKFTITLNDSVIDDRHAALNKHLQDKFGVGTVSFVVDSQSKSISINVLGVPEKLLDKVKGNTSLGHSR